MAIDLTLAIGDYDRVRPLVTGDVRPEGINLNVVHRNPGELFRQVSVHQEFKLTEMSLATFILWTSRGECPYVGIPVFPSRVFRHSAIYVNSDAGIEEPADLRGKKVGLKPYYQMTAAVWVRGLLQDEYGVNPEDIVWYPGVEEPQPLSIPDVDIRLLDDERAIEKVLAAGDLDALVSVTIPEQLGTGVERLFPDFKEVEKGYYEETGIFPIMHTLVLHKEVYEENPWVARSVYEAMCKAKDQAIHNLSTSTAFPATLPWLIDHIKEVREIMGDDYWPYGFQPNYDTLETLARYVHEQGLAERRADPKELFVDELLGSGAGPDDFFQQQERI